MRDRTKKTTSALEAAVRFTLEREGFPAPLPQLSIDDIYGDQAGVFDLTWPERNVVVFVQSGAWHRSSPAFEKDNAQISALAATGWRVVTVTHKRLRDEPQKFFDELRATLAFDKQ